MQEVTSGIPAWVQQDSANEATHNDDIAPSSQPNGSRYRQLTDSHRNTDQHNQHAGNYQAHTAAQWYGNINEPSCISRKNQRAKTYMNRRETDGHKQLRHSQQQLRTDPATITKHGSWIKTLISTCHHRHHRQHRQHNNKIFRTIQTPSLLQKGPIVFKSQMNASTINVNFHHQIIYKHSDNWSTTLLHGIIATSTQIQGSDAMTHTQE